MIATIQKSRDLSLLSLSSALSSTTTAQAQKAYFYQQLFGITISSTFHEGLCNVLAAYYTELALLTCRIPQRPSVNLLDQSAWEAKLTAAVSSLGDTLYEGTLSPAGGAADALYPATPYQVLNGGSSWLANSFDSGDRLSLAGSLYYSATGLIESIGTAADSGSYRSSVSYGTGLIGARTSDNTPVGSSQFGNGTIDSPDFYNNGVPPSPNQPNVQNFRTNLVNGIASTITFLNSYVTQINAIIAMLTKIQNGTNTIFSQFGMAADVPTSDIATLTTDLTTINGYISNLTAYSTYFNSFPAMDDLTGQSGYNRSSFNSALTAMGTLAGQIRTYCTTRSSAVTSVIGNVANGTTPTAGLRKWLAFWVGQLIGKPSSPFTAIVSLSNLAPYNSTYGNNGSNAQANAVLALASIAVTLGTLLGAGKTGQYIEKPAVIAYSNPVIDSITGTVVGQRITLLVQGAMASNRHAVYRMTIPSGTIPTDNTPWATAAYGNISTVDPATGFTALIFNDLSVTVGTTYIYRVQSFDTANSPNSRARLDTYESGSLQSDLYLGVTAVQSITGNNCTSTGHTLLAGQLVFCPIDGVFHQVGGVSATNFVLLGAAIADTATPFNVTLMQGVVLL
jgi:hypothetical protein